MGGAGGSERGAAILCPNELMMNIGRPVEKVGTGE